MKDDNKNVPASGAVLCLSSYNNHAVSEHDLRTLIALFYIISGKLIFFGVFLMLDVYIGFFLFPCFPLKDLVCCYLSWKSMQLCHHPVFQKVTFFFSDVKPAGFCLGTTLLADTLATGSVLL